tara:strand:- start:637 stop:2481 length:1845 start_codon:yes stop_codon:yes gene_type:complete
MEPIEDFSKIVRGNFVHSGDSSIKKRPKGLRKGTSRKGGGCGCSTKRKKISQGPGTELLAIMKAKGVPSCQGCRDAAKRMDDWGFRGCRERIELIIEEILPRARDWVAKDRKWIHRLLPNAVEDAGIRIALRVYIDQAINQAESKKRKRRPLRSRASRSRIQSDLVKWADSPNPIVTIQPVIRTSYRKNPTLESTISSLASAGFQEPLIFSEPDSPEWNNETLRFDRQLKPFRSFIATCEWLLENSKADWFLLCEDDVKFRAGAADLIRTYPISESQAMSLYVSTDQQKSVGGEGFAAVTGDLHGSLSYLVHKSTIKKVLSSNTFLKWPSKDRVDRAFSQATSEVSCELITHNPSLAQHIGDTSTINPMRKLSAGRLSIFTPTRHESPLTTLITPTGDRPEAFSLCEKWMRNQRYTGPIQWIVVDDGKVPTKCNEGQTYIRQEPSRGHTLCANLRAALPLIKGRNIFVIEDDEYYGPDYLSTMVGQLEHADLVGERAAKYYFIKESKWMQYPDWVHTSLCRMGMTESVLPTLLESITGTDHRSVDLRVWDLWGSSRRVWVDSTGDMRLGVGIKGMPGRSCGLHTAPHHAIADPDHSKLRQMLGPDAKVYLEMFQ